MSRDVIEFPDSIHAFRPDPVTNLHTPNPKFDFISLNPELIRMKVHRAPRYPQILPDARRRRLNTY